MNESEEGTKSLLCPSKSFQKSSLFSLRARQPSSWFWGCQLLSATLPCLQITRSSSPLKPPQVTLQSTEMVLTWPPVEWHSLAYHVFWHLGTWRLSLFLHEETDVTKLRNWSLIRQVDILRIEIRNSASPRRKRLSSTLRVFWELGLELLINVLVLPFHGRLTIRLPALGCPSADPWHSSKTFPQISINSQIGISLYRT